MISLDRSGYELHSHTLGVWELLQSEPKRLAHGPQRHSTGTSGGTPPWKGHWSPPSKFERAGVSNAQKDNEQLGRNVACIR